MWKELIFESKPKDNEKITEMSFNKICSYLVIGNNKG